MSKVIGVLGIMFLMNIAMFIFAYSGSCVGDDCQLSSFNPEGSNATTNSTLWTYFTNPTSGPESSFWNMLFGSSAGLLTLLIVGGGITVGAFAISRDINIAFITIAIYLSAICTGTWIRFLILINDSAFVIGGGSGGVVAAIGSGILLIAQIFILIDWGRGL